MLIQRLLLIIGFIALGCLTQSLGQTIIKATSVNQCGGENHIEIALVRRDSTLHFIRNDISFLPLYFWGTNFNYNQHLNDLPFSKKAINDTIYDTVFFPKLDFIVLISNPPFSYYNYCDSLANGSIVDCYSPGKPRIAGNFEDGQPTDTIFKYNYGGGLYSWEYSVGKQYETVQYYESGLVEHSYSQRKKVESYYYRSGQMKQMSSWKKRSGYRTQRYHSNGETSYKQKKNITSTFNPNGKIESQIKRRGAKRYLERYPRLNQKVRSADKYLWSIFDTLGNQICIIEYYDFDNNIGFDPIKNNALAFNNFENALMLSQEKGNYKLEKVFINTEEYTGFTIQLFTRKNDYWVIEREVSTTKIRDAIESILGAGL